MLPLLPLLLTACDPDHTPSFGDGGDGWGIQVEGSEWNGRVVTVRWTSDTDAVGWVEYGPDATLGRSTWPETEAGRHHAIQFVGEAPGVPTSFRVVHETAWGREESDVLTWTGTGAGAPTSALTVASDMQARGGYRTAVVTGMTPGPVVLDERGEFVWWTDTGEGKIVPLEMRLLEGGDQFVYMNLDISGDSDACELVRTRLDGMVLGRTSCPWGHHDFTILPDGRAAWLALDVREVDGDPVVGDQVMVGALDDSGVSEVLWSAWDSLPVDTSVEQNPFYDQGYDWTHADSIGVDAASGLLLVSLNNVDAVVALEIDSGAVAWQLGGPASTFRLEGGGFDHPHGASMVGDEVVLMDNGSGEPGVLSTVARYELDGDVARRVASYGTGPYTNLFLGDVDPAADGFVVAWGSEGVVEELDADGHATWRATADLGNVLARVNWNERLGGPLAE